MHHSNGRINESRNHNRRREVIDENGVDISTTRSHRHRRRDSQTLHPPRFVGRRPDPDLYLDNLNSYRRRSSRQPSRTDSLGVGYSTARHDGRTGRPRETRQQHNHDPRRTQFEYSNERRPRGPQHHITYIRADRLEIRDNCDLDRTPHREHRKKRDKEFTHSKQPEKSSKRSKNDAVPDPHASSSASPRGETEKEDKQSSNGAKKEGKAWKAPGLMPFAEEGEDDEDEGAYGNPLNTFGGAIESEDEEEEPLISQQPKSNEEKTKNEEGDIDRKPASNGKEPEAKKGTSLLGMFKRLKTFSSPK